MQSTTDEGTPQELPQSAELVLFPLREVATNLSHQLDRSATIFDAIKKIGRFIREEKTLSESGKRSLEEVMKQLLEAGTSLSDEAYETGTVVKQFVNKRDTT